jgi:hypothetical protein
MVNIRLMSGLLCVLLSVPAFARGSYLCVADMATGFMFDKSRKQWYSANFKADGKYLVSKPPEPIPRMWLIHVAGHASGGGIS